MKLLKKSWFVMVFAALVLFVGACDSKSILAATIKIVEESMPTTLNDGDVLSITAINTDKVTITWVSRNEDVIAANGKVIAGTSDIEVEIAVTYSEGSVSRTKIYAIMVKAKEIVDTTLADVKAALTVVSETKVDLTLPTSQNGVLIAWSSDHAAISSTGVVTRGDADITVTLTATLTYKGQTGTKEFTVVVKAKEVVDTTLADVKAALTVVTETEVDLDLPAEISGVSIAWSSNHAAISSTGVVTRGDADITVTLTATLTYKGQAETKEFTVVVKAKEVVDTTLADVKAALTVLSETEEDLDLPTEINGVVITWESNHVAISATGVVTRGDEDIVVTLIATLTYNGQTETKEFTVIVKEIVDTTLLEALDSLTVVTETEEDLDLPTEINGVVITWESNHAAISTTGAVLRSDEDIIVTLVATLSYKGKEKTKEFTVTVLALPDTTAPELVSVTPGAGVIAIGEGKAFILKVAAKDKNLYSLEVDHSLQSILPEFTVYADAANPYGSEEARVAFEQAGVTVSYNAQTQTWTFNFGVALTKVMVDNAGITFYFVVSDSEGNQFGSMSPTTPDNTFAYTFTGLPQLPTPINGFGPYVGYEEFGFAMGAYVFPELPRSAFKGFEYSFTNVTDQTVYKYFVSASLGGGSGAFKLSEIGIAFTPGDYTVKVVAVGDNETHLNSLPFGNDSIIFNLPYPDLDPVKLSLSEDELLVSWNEIVGATYTLYLNGVEQAIEGLSFSLPTEPGIYTIRIVVSAEGFNSNEDTLVYEVKSAEAVQLDTPINLVIENKVLTWDVVENAMGYIVRIGALAPIAVEVESLDLSKIIIPLGTHSITVMAKGDAVAFVDSEVSEAISYEINVEDLPKLEAPLHGMGHTPHIYHFGIGPYDRESTKSGYSGKLRIVFTHKTTGAVINVEINAPFGTGSAYIYKDLNLPWGDYEVRFQAVGNQTTHQDSDFHPGVVTITIEKAQLAKPIIVKSADGLSITWSPVVNATSYEVYVNDVIQDDGEIFSFVLPTEPGEYTIKVVAKDENYQDSFDTMIYVVQSAEATPLDAPIVTLENSIISWEAVEHASRYKVVVGAVETTVSALSYDLSKLDLNSGTYKTYVIALSDDPLNYVDSDASNEVEYVVAVSLPRLNAMTAGDFVATYLLNGVDGGHRKFEIYRGHPVFQQSGWTNKVKVGIRVNGTMIYEQFDFGQGGMVMLHTPNSTSSFFGRNLPAKDPAVELHLILVGNGSTHKDSEPLVLTMNWSRS